MTAGGYRELLEWTAQGRIRNWLATMKRLLRTIILIITVPL